MTLTDTRFWTRIDGPGLERLELQRDGLWTTAIGTLVAVTGDGLSLTYAWRLDPDWRTVSLTIDRHGPAGHARLVLERVGEGWHVDGAARPDLDGCAEPDLSATPFCNAMAIRGLDDEPGAIFDLDVAYINAAALAVTRSTQRYERIGEHAVRYTNLDVANGFTALLTLDHDGLVKHYEHLFDRIYPGS